MSLPKWVAGAALLAGGVAVGAVVSLSAAAGAATPTPSPSATSTSPSTGSTTTTPDVQESSGVPEATEHHGHGGDLSLTGTVTAVTTNSVTIKTATGTTTYAVNATSDIDKNGEAALKDLVVGDAVRYSVVTGTTTIDKLHAGNETQNRPSHADETGETTTTPSTTTPSTAPSTSSTAGTTGAGFDTSVAGATA